jgi:hypothetical protein
MNDKELALSHERLVSLLEYKESTGEFTWKISTAQAVKAGEIAGTIIPKGYRHITINGHKYRAHRLAWFYMYKEWPYPEIDHINRETDDNRIENLRVVTKSENANNRVYVGGLSVRDNAAYQRERYPDSQRCSNNWSDEKRKRMTEYKRAWRKARREANDSHPLLLRDE